MTGVLTKKENLDADLHTRRMPHEQEGKDGMMCLQAKKCQELPANHQRLAVISMKQSLTTCSKSQP